MSNEALGPNLHRQIPKVLQQHQSRASNAEPVTSGPRSEIIPAIQPEVDNGTHHDPSESHQETPIMLRIGSMK